MENEFTWDNATVYFVIPDRFYNESTSNDHSYGRRNDYGDGLLSTGTFHGGDLAGLTDKLEEGYFKNLGINAIWITAPYEQIHGFVGGGDLGDLPHYAYHGYYTLDYTSIDQNMGTIQEMREFVNTAHEQGIRVVSASESEVINCTPNYGNWHSYHDQYFDYNSQSAWQNWWRAGLPGYTPGGGDDLTRNLAGLPDFRTELTNNQG